MKNKNSIYRQAIFTQMMLIPFGGTLAYEIGGLLTEHAQGVVQDFNGRQVAKWAQYSYRRFRSFRDSGYVWIVRTK